MLITCPHCDARDESEFTYRGDATVVRPEPDAGTDAFHDYVYLRRNPLGWHVEWWQHGACRQWLRVVRQTMTHEIRQVALPQEIVEVPQE